MNQNLPMEVSVYTCGSITDDIFEQNAVSDLFHFKMQR
jgi:hypothetical protein